MRIEELSLSEWEDALPSDGFEVFHTPEALGVVESHTTGELRLYGGFKGQQPVGLLPVVVQERSLGTAVLSPPPALGIPRLGPVLMPTSPKRRKREKVNSSFTEQVLEEVDADSSLTLFRMVCNTGYVDPRPYRWADLDLDTSFTYSLDLDGADSAEVLKSFSKSLRREIRDGLDLDVSVTVHGVEAAHDVYEETRSRYAEQDQPFPMEWAYVRDLVSALDDRARVYVARTPDGEFLSGITVLYSNDAGYFWQGGARTTHRNVSVNSLLHWHIIQDIADDPPVEGVSRYDLMGANTERICRYKSKFGAELVPYYVVESPGKHMDVAKKAYQVLAR
jgi:lipid II:glycine glycyltransferase (peptidoglycan interpeptide bridge formation enzyme)